MLRLLMLVCLLIPGEARATFPGDNGLIAFHSESMGGIYTIRPDGSRRRKLARDGFEPAWSPDGRRIAYVRLPASGNSQLVIMRANGRGKRIVGRGLGPVLWEPAWSPDGSQLVYRLGFARSGGGVLYVVRTDGTGARLVTFRESAAGENPDWSVPLPSAPQGRIAFAWFPAPAPCYATEIFTIDPAGQDEPASRAGDRTLVPFGCNVSFHPSWHPAGTQLAFASYTTGGPPELTDIYVGDSAGTSRRRLTDLPGYDVEPAWSPQGDQIVFVNDRLEDGISQGLFLVDPSNPFLTVPIPNTADVQAGRPDWQPR